MRFIATISAMVAIARTVTAAQILDPVRPGEVMDFNYFNEFKWTVDPYVFNQISLRRAIYDYAIYEQQLISGRGEPNSTFHLYLTRYEYQGEDLYKCVEIAANLHALDLSHGLRGRALHGKITGGYVTIPISSPHTLKWLTWAFTVASTLYRLRLQRKRECEPTATISESPESFRVAPYSNPCPSRGQEYERVLGPNACCVGLVCGWNPTYPWIKNPQCWYPSESTGQIDAPEPGSTNVSLLEE